VPLVTIDDGRDFTLDVSIDESRAAAISVGTVVKVAIDGFSEADGRVHEIERAIDSTGRTVRLKIALFPDERLRSGMFGRVAVPGESRQIVTVPRTALVRQGQLTLVFVAEDDVARLRAVRESGPAGERAGLVAGLKPGELVVTSPPTDLTDGRRLAAGRHP
jgi:hypothetical protein